jgi:hypothetical protein
MRNDMCFQGLCWSKVEVLFRSCARLIKNWLILSKTEGATLLETWAQAMEGKSARPPRLEWRPQTSASFNSDISEESVFFLL